MILREGRIDDNVLDRSVKKRLENALDRRFGGTSSCTYSYSCLWKTRFSAALSVIGAVNGLAARGIQPVSVRTDILLPSGSEESLLREIEDEIRDTAQKADVTISGGHTTVTAAVARPIITVQAEGDMFFPGLLPFRESKKSSDKETARAVSADDDTEDDDKDILVIGHIGLEGTFLLADEKRKGLEERFPVQMMDKAVSMKRSLLMTEQARAFYEYLKAGGTGTLIRVSDGGIYAGLWKLAGMLNCGFEISLPEIPIFQETIEICNYYDINPYQMASEGCFLEAVSNGEDLLNFFEKKELFARRIGHTTAGRDKIIVNGDERQNLNRPAPDALIPLLG